MGMNSAPKPSPIMATLTFLSDIVPPVDECADVKEYCECGEFSRNKIENFNARMINSSRTSCQPVRLPCALHGRAGSPSYEDSFNAKTAPRRPPDRDLQRLRPRPFARCRGVCARTSAVVDLFCRTGTWRPAAAVAGKLGRRRRHRAD